MNFKQFAIMVLVQGVRLTLIAIMADVGPV